MSARYSRPCQGNCGLSKTCSHHWTCDRCLDIKVAEDLRSQQSTKRDDLLDVQDIEQMKSWLLKYIVD